MLYAFYYANYVRGYSGSNRNTYYWLADRLCSEWLDLNAEAARVIDSALVHKGDVLRMVAGETVPADGLLMGAVGLDESLMTVS